MTALPIARPRPPAIHHSAKPARTASPIVRALFNEIDRRGIEYAQAARQAGISGPRLSQWKHGERAPKCPDFEALVAACGFRLKLEPIDPNEGQTA